MTLSPSHESRDRELSRKHELDDEFADDLANEYLDLFYDYPELEIIGISQDAIPSPGTIYLAMRRVKHIKDPEVKELALDGLTELRTLLRTYNQPTDITEENKNV